MCCCAGVCAEMDLPKDRLPEAPIVLRGVAKLASPALEGRERPEALSEDCVAEPYTSLNGDAMSKPRDGVAEAASFSSVAAVDDRAGVDIATGVAVVLEFFDLTFLLVAPLASVADLRFFFLTSPTFTDSADIEAWRRKCAKGRLHRDTDAWRFGFARSRPAVESRVAGGSILP